MLKLEDVQRPVGLRISWSSQRLAVGIEGDYRAGVDARLNDSARRRRGGVIAHDAQRVHYRRALLRPTVGDQFLLIILDFSDDGTGCHLR